MPILSCNDSKTGICKMLSLENYLSQVTLSCSIITKKKGGYLFFSFFKGGLGGLVGQRKTIYIYIFFLEGKIYYKMTKFRLWKRSTEM